MSHEDYMHYYDDDEEEEEEEVEEEEEEDDHPRHTQFLDLTNGKGGALEDLGSPGFFDDGEIVSNPGPPRSSRKVDPSTPGRVVETGHEHTGRWTREEHEAFLSALKMYGKEWKKVAAKVKTRTVVQTRTHAQKYFQKLQKAIGGNGRDIGYIDMGVSSETKRASAQKKKLKQHHMLKPHRSQSTSAAAHMLTHLPAIPSQSVAGGGYASSYPTHGFSSSSAISELPPPPAFPPPSSNYYSSVTESSASWGPPSMSIVAPNHEVAMRRGFPEPSPAASGKRKLAELAAAQMLAGVAASTEHHIDGDVTPPPMEPSPDRPPPKFGLSLQIVNPETLGITYDETKKRRRGGEPSPTTPWDGQLEQLVCEQKKKKGTDIETKSVDSIEHHGFQFPHPICGPGVSYGRSPLHKAVCEMDMGSVHQELSDSIGAACLHRKDEIGFNPIHSACALSMLDPENSPMACEITRLLINAGGEVSVVDGCKNTPLHWAARAGDADVVKLLLMKNCPPDAQNEDGDTALHWAMRAGRRGMNAVRVLLENGARASVSSNSFRRPLDVAAEGFDDEKILLRTEVDTKKTVKNRALKAESMKRRTELIEEKREARSNFLLLSTQSRTLVLHHPECSDHIPKSESDWEVPDRINAIVRRVAPDEETGETTGIFPYEVVVSTDFERAKLDFLSRVHSSDYLSFVNDLSKELSKRKKDEESESHCDSIKSAPVVPFTPMVQKTVLKEFQVKKESHSDTAFSAGSLRAARRAAGAVQHAVDCVLVGRHRNAFCVVRPPGHHAGVKGLLAGGESCGFCIFNNVAAGALHAISDERLMCQRVAIVDFDAHHGNGTEEIVKRCQDPGKLFFFSIHLFDNERRKNGYSFYPGTGDEDDIAHNIINVPIAPLWKDQVQPPSSPIPPVSTHNTRHKAKQKAAENQSTVSGNDDSSETGALSSNELLQRTSDTESETASLKGSLHGSTKSSSRVSTPRLNMGRAAYRRSIQNRLLPALRAFNPDLILISAGFDAAKGDVGNARHYLGGKERMGLDLEPEDYAWTTRKVLEIADICCHGRVVSVLEGGYGRSPLVPPSSLPAPPIPGELPLMPVPVPPRKLDKAFFSECAIRHLHAMIDPYDLELRFG